MRSKRSDFLLGIGATASIGALDGAHAFAQAVLPADPALAIQTILDGFVAHNRASAKMSAGIVAGVITPKLRTARLFFGGKLVAARNQRMPVPLDGDTPFLIGSITKVFTSAIFGIRGNSYDAPLGDFVEISLPSGVANLQMRSIANYSSGFPTDNTPPVWWDRMHPVDLNALIDGLSGKVLPQCVPGQIYSYSNFSWGLFGLAAVGVASAKSPALASWNAAIGQLRARIGLSGRTAPWNASVPLAAGYAQNGRLLPPSFEYGLAHWATLFGGGDLVSTGNDMLAWLAYNMGRTSSADSTLLHAQQSPDFAWNSQAPPTPSGSTFCAPARRLRDPVHTALGWFRSNDFFDPRVTVMSKNGGVAGYSSWMGFQSWVDTMEESPAGAFVLTNDGDAAASRIGRALMNYLLQS